MTEAIERSQVRFSAMIKLRNKHGQGRVRANVVSGSLYIMALSRYM